MTEINGKAPRYAIYFSPGQHTSLYQLGSEWLGRDAGTGAVREPQLPMELRREDWLEVTASPRRYGFHATLKPPFRLAPDAQLDELCNSLRSFATKQKSFSVPLLHLSTLGRFLALTLAEPSRNFEDLAAASVEDLDHFREPETSEEMALRFRDDMPRREKENLIRWGYPYVFDTWKFHMTLTNSLQRERLPFFQSHLRERFARVCNEGFVVDAICLFEEPERGSDFRIIEQFPLGPAL